MTISLAAATKNAEADATARLLDAGYAKIYSGTVPANADASIGSATLLSTLTFAGTSGSAASGGVFTAAALTQDSDAAGTGTASFFRWFKSNGSTVVGQGTVTATGGDGDMTLPTTTINQHDVVTCSSCTYTRP